MPMKITAASMLLLDQIRVASSVNKEQLLQQKIMLREELDIRLDQKSGKIEAAKQLFYGQFVIDESMRRLMKMPLKNYRKNKKGLAYPFDNNDAWISITRKLIFWINIRLNIAFLASRRIP